MDSPASQCVSGLSYFYLFVNCKISIVFTVDVDYEVLASLLKDVLNFKWAST